MCIVVQHQLTVVTGECGIVVVSCKMPHIFTNAENANMPYVYVICDGSATAADEDYRRGFRMRIIPDRRVFSKVLSYSDTTPPRYTKDPASSISLSSNLNFCMLDY
jgi:hypothetical protein